MKNNNFMSLREMFCISCENHTRYTNTLSFKMESGGSKKCFIKLLEPTSYVMYQQFNLLKPTGYVMHQQFNIQQLYVLPTLYLCVLYLSENKQRLVPLTA